MRDLPGSVRGDQRRVSATESVEENAGVRVDVGEKPASPFCLELATRCATAFRHATPFRHARLRTGLATQLAH